MMLKTRLSRIFKKKSYQKVDNYTFEDIPIENFFKVDELNLRYISKDGKFNNECVDAYYKMQDEYLQLHGGDTHEMKKYKAVCWELFQKLLQYNQNPVLKGRIMNEVDRLYNRKNELSQSLFKKEVENLDYTILVAQVSIRLQSVIDPKTMNAKYFFNIIKSINDGAKVETN